MIAPSSSSASKIVVAGDATISSSSARVGARAELESCGTSRAKAATSSSDTVVAWVTVTSG